MKRLILTFCLLCSSVLAEVTYVPGIADLPVPEGFSLKTDSSNIFDVEEGKIVDATFAGDGSREKIIDFYNQTLPELGWSAINDTSYERDGEILDIKIVEDIFSDEMEITYSLRPMIE